MLGGVARWLGGKGSGNFGHEGRPGEVGGSAPLTHGTALDNAQSIIDTGLKADGAPVWTSRNEKVALSYALSSSVAREQDKLAIVVLAPEAEKLFDQSLGTTFTPRSAVPPELIREVRIYAVDDFKKIGPDGEQLRWSKEWAKSGEMPAPVQVLKGKWRGLAEHASNEPIYAVVLLSHLKTLGGKGSGNFGHAGRPGEQGGSSSYSETERDAVQNYSAGSQPINDALRSGHEVPLGYQKDVKNLEAILQRTTTPRDITLYRAVPIEVFSAYQDGQVFKDPAFVSASTLPNIVSKLQDELGAAEQFVPIKILVPQGTGIIDVNAVLHGRPTYHEFAWQNEMLLGPGHQFEVTRNGSRVTLSLIPHPRVLGGKGSGNFGHAGRPGEQGGSAPDRLETTVTHEQLKASLNHLQQLEHPADHSEVLDRSAIDALNVLLTDAAYPLTTTEHVNAFIINKDGIITAAGSILKVDDLNETMFLTGAGLEPGQAEPIINSLLEQADKKWGPSEVSVDPDVFAFSERVQVPKDGFVAGEKYHNDLPGPIFHGTADVALESIKANGLVPKGGKGADEWAKAAGWNNITKYDIGGRSHSVFMTDSMRAAQTFADYAAKVNKAHPVVLAIDVPPAHLGKLIPDEISAPSLKAYRYEGKIPPEWIKVVTNVTGARGGLRPLEALPDGTHRIFAIFLVDGLKTAGGHGSGNFGHAGRPGEVGGSAAQQALVEKLGVSTTMEPGGTGFILPNGTRVPHGGRHHAIAAGGKEKLSELLREGVIRHVPEGIEIWQPITDAQAETIADDWNGRALRGERSVFYVDVAKDDKLLGNKMFDASTEEITPGAIQDFVRSTLDKATRTLAGYSTDQPRDDHGRWSPEAGDEHVVPQSAIPAYSPTGHYPLYHFSNSVWLDSFIELDGVGRGVDFSPSTGYERLDPNGSSSWTRDPHYAVKGTDSDVRLTIEDKQELNVQTIPVTDYLATDISGDHLMPGTFEHEERVPGVVPLDKISAIHVTHAVDKDLHERVRLYTEYAKKTPAYLPLIDKVQRILDHPKYQVGLTVRTDLDRKTGRYRKYRDLGGKGSGNFGHTGRPGEVGGSGDTFHGTSVKAAEKIKTEGLKPGQHDSVFVAHEAGDALSYAIGQGRGIGDTSPVPDDNDAVALVVVSGAASHYFDTIRVPVAPGRVTHYGVSSRAVPARYIKEVRLYRAGDVRRWQDHGEKGTLKFKTLAAGDLFVAIVLVTEPRALGGKGSGNFGHAGRPGEQGGSAPDLDVNAVNLGSSRAFDIRKITDRRFLYNPTNDTLVLGAELSERERRRDADVFETPEDSHAAVLDAVLGHHVVGHEYDQYSVKGHLGTNLKYYSDKDPNGVVNIFNGWFPTADDALNAKDKLISRLMQSGVTGETLIGDEFGHGKPLKNSEFSYLLAKKSRKLEATFLALESSTQVDTPRNIAAYVEGLASLIPDDQVIKRENHPHVTVLYGIHATEPDAVRVVLEDSPPVTITIGDLSVFSNPEQDVLKFDVSSPDLEALNALLQSKIGATNDYGDEYIPHITVAYLKPGCGEMWVGMPNPLTGRTFTVDTLVFSDDERNATEIHLSDNAARQRVASAITDLIMSAVYSEFNDIARFLKAKHPVHVVADKNRPALQSAFGQAFARARKTLSIDSIVADLEAGRQPNVEPALAAFADGLKAPVAQSLLDCAIGGARQAANKLNGLKTAEFNPDEPRDDHGQWTAMGGELPKTPAARGRALDIYGITGNRDAAITAVNVASAFGFPLDKIIVKDLSRKSFSSGGKRWYMLGAYNPANGEVYFDKRLPTDQVTRTLTHELTHSAFAEVKMAITPEAQEFKEYTSVFAEDLAKSDGVTDYSRAYWNGELSGSRSRAIDETFAEISKLKVGNAESAEEVHSLLRGGNDKIAPVWDEAHKLLIRAYDSLGKKHRAAEFNPDQPRDDHGQWTSSGEASAALGMMSSARAYKRRLADSIAVENGFDPNKINFVPINRAFTVGGKTFNEGAHYNPSTGEINVGNRVLRSSDPDLSQLLAHEITHDAYHKVLGQYDAGGADIPPPEASAKIFEFMGDHGETLAKDDGITDYSRAYWAAYEKANTEYDGEANEEFMRAVNETLGEISAGPYMNPYIREWKNLAEPTPVWRELHSKVMAAYRNLPKNHTAFGSVQ